jgi:hypothetical protein
VLKGDWKAGGVDGECLGWNANLSDWVKLSTLAPLQTYLNY